MKPPERTWALQTLSELSRHQTSQEKDVLKGVGECGLCPGHGAGKHRAAVFHVNKYTRCSQIAGGFPKDMLCCWSLWGLPAGDGGFVWAPLALCWSLLDLWQFLALFGTPS